MDPIGSRCGRDTPIDPVPSHQTVTRYDVDIEHLVIYDITSCIVFKGKSAPISREFSALCQNRRIICQSKSVALAVGTTTLSLCSQWRYFSDFVMIYIPTPSDQLCLPNLCELELVHTATATP